MMRAAGCARRARRMAWRAWRIASAVTAQVLNIDGVAEAGFGRALARITSDS